MGNNVVASVNDITSAFWNPAALGFAPVREFQGGVDVAMERERTTFFGNEVHADLMRPRFSHLGALFAIPTARGGCAIGVSYQSPYTLDDILVFEGTHIEADGDTVRSARDYRAFGDLRLWGASFGIQVAPGLAAGVSASLMAGRDDIRDSYLTTEAGLIQSLSDDYDDSWSRSYLGFDVRVGLLYSLKERLRIGGRLELPQRVRFSETGTREHPHLPSQPDYSWDVNGTLVSSYRGALGVSVALPFATVSGEVRGRAPYSMVYPNERFASTSSARHFRTGLGAGVEAPLFVEQLLLRAGYSWDEYDMHAFAVTYDGEETDWEDYGIEADRNRHLVTAGAGYLAGNFCFDLAYAVEVWGLSVREALDEEHVFQRLSFSLSLRY
jgi:long-subunit fatty acid transport protein